MNYNVNVNIKGKEKIDALEKQLNTLSKKPAKITVDVDSRNLNSAMNKSISQSIAELRKEITALSGIDITFDSSSLKEAYDILDKLSIKLKSLSDIQQPSVTRSAAVNESGNSTEQALKDAIDAGTNLLKILTQIKNIGGIIDSAGLIKNLDKPTNHRVSA